MNDTSPDRRNTRDAVSSLAIAGFLLMCLAAIVIPITIVFTWVLPAWNTSVTFLVGVEHQRSTLKQTPRLGERVFFVVLDGVGYDRISSAQRFVPWREIGTLRPLRADFPTYTAPSITALMTGVPPEDSGVRLNGIAVGVGGLDALAHTAWSTGTYVRVRSRTYRPFEALVRPPEGASVAPGRIRFLIDMLAMTTVPRPSDASGHAAELTFVHLGEVDEEGHAHGADSSQYRIALEHALDLLDNLHSRLDPTRDVLFVASDHGHRAGRGHGGTEPEVVNAFVYATGRGIRREATLEARPMRDVTSTVAIAAGIPTPSSNLGSPMLDMFEATDEQRARMRAEGFDQTARLHCAITPAECTPFDGILSALERGDAGALPQASAFVHGFETRLAEKKHASARALRARNITYGAVFALLQIVLLARLRARRGRALAMLAATFAVYVSYLMFKGYGPSLSAMAPIEVFLPDAVKASALSLPVSLFIAYRARLNGSDAAFFAGTGLLLLIPLWANLQMSPRLVEDPVLSTLAFQLSPLGPAVGLTALVVGLLSWIRRR